MARAGPAGWPGRRGDVRAARPDLEEHRRPVPALPAAAAARRADQRCAAGVEGLFTAAGWSDAVGADVALAVRFDGADRWYRFSMSVGQRGFWGMVPEDKRAGIRKAAAGIIEDAAGPDGSVTFTQGIRYTLARNG